MMEFDANGIVEYGTRSKRTRLEQSKCNDGSGARTLELHEVITTLKAYDADSADGGINCSICGKLYKSKVCFTKHLWEHSIYWDLFDGEKNHDRVLSIQAALILYNGYHSDAMETEDVSFLLVTAPHNDKKKERDFNANEIKNRNKNEKQNGSPAKRKRSSSVASTSGSDTEKM